MNCQFHHCCPPIFVEHVHKTSSQPSNRKEMAFDTRKSSAKYIWIEWILPIYLPKQLVVLWLVGLVEPFFVVMQTIPNELQPVPVQIQIMDRNFSRSSFLCRNLRCEYASWMCFFRIYRRINILTFVTVCVTCETGSDVNRISWTNSSRRPICLKFKFFSV